MINCFLDKLVNQSGAFFGINVITVRRFDQYSVEINRFLEKDEKSGPNGLSVRA